MTEINLPCPSCGSLVAPHAALCGNCETSLTRDKAGRLMNAPRTAQAGKRSCPRCGGSVDLTAARCPHCKKQLHNSHRAGAIATILLVIGLCALIAINGWRRFTGRTNQTAHVVSESDARALRAHHAAEMAARETFAADLAREYKNTEINITVDVSGDDRDVMTLGSRKFNEQRVQKVNENREVITALRRMGFTRLIYSNGSGKTWTQDLTSP